MDTKRILIIDDDEDFRFQNRTFLESHNYSVLEAISGENGLAKLTEEKPDLIILDIMMETDQEGYVLNDLIKYNDVVGMLYIGELEHIYTDKKHYTLFTSVGVLFFIILLSFFVGVLMIYHARKLELEKKKARFEFIRILGHELKSPINAIESYLKLMDKRIVGEIPESYDKMIRRSLIRVEYMRKLITDLLDSTRIESGQKKRELTDVNVCEVAKESIETMVSLSADRNIIINLLSHQPVHLIADRSEIEIMFNNLISNAVKYNHDSGRVDVIVKSVDKKIQIDVKDTGISMTEDEIKKLFNEFVRIKNEKTSNILGSGLGLSIVKKIVLLYDGETHVVSEPDKGTTFTIILK